MFRNRALFLAVSIAAAIFPTPLLKADQFNLTIQQYGEFYYYEGVGDGGGYASENGQIMSGKHTEDGGASFSDYFVLDLSSIPSDQTITSVSFNASNPFFTDEFGSSATVSYWLGETSAAPSDLENPTSSNTAALYGDLSNASVSFGATPDYTFTNDGAGPTSISLQGDSTFVDLLNENRGGLLAIAGNLNGGSDGVSIEPSSPVFIVTTVPEPGSSVLLSGGAAVCGLALTRRFVKR